MGSRSSGGRAAEEEVPNTELYARLHVSPSASAEEIRKAFLYWSGVAHPDKHLDPQLKDAATENFRQIVEAYDILNDPDKRQIYDIYGMEGLSSGLELGPHLNKVDELKEELEKLKRHKEHEKALAHSGASVMLLGRLSLPDYLEGGRIINRMEMASDFQSQISKRNIVSVNGRFVVSGESGQGSATVVFRHYVSPGTEVDFRATAGLRSLIGFQASRQLSNHSTASSGFMVSLGDGSVNLSNTWGRQLSETSSGNRVAMDPGMEQLRQTLVEVETEAEKLFLARHQLVENDRLRNGNREALTALRRRARTTKSSVPSPFEAVMREIEGTKELVKEICPTCGDHDSKEHTWMMFPGYDIFVRMPFHAAHTTLGKDQERLDFDSKKLQSYVKEKSFLISETGALADRISPGLVNSLITLTDTPKSASF